jgi:SAM-dependent methyltransferase
MTIQRILSSRGDAGVAADIGERNRQRRAEIERAITQLPPYRDCLRILDAGCGANRRLRLPEQSMVVGIDNSKKQLLRNSGIDAAVVADLQTYQFPSHSFDAVLCWDVLEHLTDPLAAMEGMAEALVPGGLFIIASPNLWSLKGLITRFTPHRFHVWFYRHILGSPDAGKDDAAPFPTVLSRAMTPSGIRDFAATRGVNLVKLNIFDGDQQEEVRSRYPAASVLFHVVGASSRLISGGRFDLTHSDYIAVLQRSKNGGAGRVTHIGED